MEKVVIDQERCKGCGLCQRYCSSQILYLSKDVINKAGFHPTMVINQKACIGCANCAMMCPDAAIEVYKEVRPMY